MRALKKQDFPKIFAKENMHFVQNNNINNVVYIML